MFTKFHGCVATSKTFTIVTSSGDWAQVPQSKNSTKGIFSFGDHFYLFQHIKLIRFTKFHGSVPNSKTFTTVTSSGDWAQVPQSKNSTKGIFSVRGPLLSFPAYQIV